MHRSMKGTFILGLFWHGLGVLWMGESLLAMSSEVLFNKIKEAHRAAFPEVFRARLSSKVIDAQLKSIPEKARQLGKEPYIEFLYKLNRPFQIKIRNVEPFYEDALSDFEGILLRSGLFFGVNDIHKYEDFSEEYGMEWNPARRYAKVQEKEGFEHDWALFYVDKHFKITHADYFENKKKVAALKLHFKEKEIKPLKKKKQKVLLITKLSLWFIEGDKKTEVILGFSGHDFSPISDVHFK